MPWESGIPIAMLSFWPGHHTNYMYIIYIGILVCTSTPPASTSSRLTQYFPHLTDLLAATDIRRAVAEQQPQSQGPYQGGHQLWSSSSLRIQIRLSSRATLLRPLDSEFSLFSTRSCFSPAPVTGTSPLSCHICDTITTPPNRYSSSTVGLFHTSVSYYLRQASTLRGQRLGIMILLPRQYYQYVYTFSSPDLVTSVSHQPQSH